MTTNVYRQLLYSPSVELDRLADSNLSFNSVTPTLARRVSRPGSYDVFLHANSRCRAMENHQDVSSRYKLLRLRRYWTGNLTGSPPSPIASNYILETAKSGPLGFGADYNGQTWIDVPGEILFSPSKESRRCLQEFIVGVGDPAKERSPFPEFGGLYFVTAVDMTPTHYKIWMSLAKPMTSEQLQGALGVGGESFPTDIIQPPPIDFTSWRYVPHEWTRYTQYFA